MNSKIILHVLQGSFVRLGAFGLLVGLLAGLQVGPFISAKQLDTAGLMICLYSIMLCLATGVSGLFTWCAKYLSYHLFDSRALVFSTASFFALGIGLLQGFEIGFGCLFVAIAMYLLLAIMDRSLATSRYEFVKESRRTFHEIVVFLILATLACIVIVEAFRLFDIDATFVVAKITALSMLIGVIGVALFVSHEVQAWDNPLFVVLKCGIMGLLFGACSIVLFANPGAFTLGCKFGAGITAVYHLIMWFKWLFNIEGTRKLQWK